MNGNWGVNFGAGGVWLVSLALMIVVLVDMSKRPEWAFQRAGSSKNTWLLLVILFTVCCNVVGLILSIVYLVSIKPKVEAAQAAGPPGGAVGGYPPPPPR
jgi:hypothetical protein